MMLAGIVLSMIFEKMVGSFCLNPAAAFALKTSSFPPVLYCYNVIQVKLY